MTEVAILLATYNGARHIEEQLRSLVDNSSSFTLHWLDDHSTDGTKEVVRSVARALSLRVEEWQCDCRLRVPGSFFYLLENVESDVYLFCDQDDIWQAGKIDATASALCSGSQPPLFCFSEPVVFAGSAPELGRRYYDVIGVSAECAQSSTRAFALNPAVGNTAGISRALRDELLARIGVARAHAIMHDWWLYLLALGNGRTHFMTDVPTTLYRQHAGNVLGVGRTRWWRSLSMRWRTEQRFRAAIALQAKGFLQCTETMCRTPSLDTMIGCAREFTEIDRKRSLGQLVRMANCGELPLPRARALLFAAVCFAADASNADAISGSYARG